jgi:hypothetical protein
MPDSSSYIQEALQQFLEMYEGLDSGPSDPVHAVREHARSLLAGEPTGADMLAIARELSDALPNDARANQLGAQWETELEHRTD